MNLLFCMFGRHVWDARWSRTVGFWKECRVCGIKVCRNENERVA